MTSLKKIALKLGLVAALCTPLTGCTTDDLMTAAGIIAIGENSAYLQEDRTRPRIPRYRNFEDPTQIPEYQTPRFIDSRHR